MRAPAIAPATTIHPLVPQPSGSLESRRGTGATTETRHHSEPRRRSPHRVDRPRNVIDVSEDASPATKTREVDWDAARETFESGGLTMREIAGRFGVSPNTVSTHARKEGWERDDATVTARDAQRRANAQAAVEANKIAWAQRRGDEADEAASSAQIARVHAVAAMADRDFRMVSACAIAYGIFVDKAQLLTGGATSRTDLGSGDEGLRVRSLRDELAERRAS